MMRYLPGKPGSWKGMRSRGAEMEVRVQEPFFPARFPDWLDSELDTIGVTLDVPMVCGSCMTVMREQNRFTYTCPKCHTIFKLI